MSLVEAFFANFVKCCSEFSECYRISYEFLIISEILMWMTFQGISHYYKFIFWNKMCRNYERCCLKVAENLPKKPHPLCFANGSMTRCVGIRRRSKIDLSLCWSQENEYLLSTNKLLFQNSKLPFFLKICVRRLFLDLPAAQHAVRAATRGAAAISTARCAASCRDR